MHPPEGGTCKQRRAGAEQSLALAQWWRGSALEAIEHPHLFSKRAQLIAAGGQGLGAHEGARQQRPRLHQRLQPLEALGQRLRTSAALRFWPDLGPEHNRQSVLTCVRRADVHSFIDICLPTKLASGRRRLSTLPTIESIAAACL